MPRKMLIDASHPEETRVVVVDGQRVDQFDFETITKKQIAGNVYLARVTRVEPSLQAAFVEYGGNKHGFLPFSEIHPDYYQIPHADRAALLADAARAYQQEEEEERAPRSSGRPGEARRGRDRNDRNDRNGGAERSGARAERNGADRNGGVRREAAAAEASEAAFGASPEAGREENDSERRDSRGDSGGRRGRGRGRGRDRRRHEGRGGWVETLEQEVDLLDGSSAQLYRLERRNAAEAQEADFPEEEPAEGESIVEIRLQDGDVARLMPAERERKGPARAMAASSDDSVGGGQSGRRARFLRRRRRSDGRPEGRSEGQGAKQRPDSAERAPEFESGDSFSASGEAALQGEVLEDSDSVGEAFEVEEAGAGDAHEEAAPRRIPRGRYKIQEVIKKRQILLVQVVKEERGNKGAALTTYVSLAGRYCVLMPNTARGGGISRKITEAADRKRLKEAADELDVPKGMGLIVRTAGADRTKAEIKRDYDYLIRQWSAIRDLTLASIAPKLVYEEGDLIKRTIRDLYSKDIEEVVVEGEDGYREAKDFMKMLTPSHAKNVKPYRDDVPLFIRHQVESQLTAMFNPVVQLRSGGYIVINVTEALVAIDVNSGRSTREHSIEDTALKTNLEAAEEAARQMRLRDLAGLLVIDFIDMDDPRNDRAVERRLKDALKTDRARMQIGRISNFGLLEMSRQRLRPGMLEASTKPCPHCQGVGHVRSDESLALSILREAEEAGVREPSVGMRIVAPVAIANYLINHKRERLLSLEKRYNLAAHVDGDPTLAPSEHRLERFLLATAARAEDGPVGVDSSFSDEEEILEEAPRERSERPRPERAERSERPERSARRIEIETPPERPSEREAAPEPAPVEPVQAAPAPEPQAEPQPERAADAAPPARRERRERRPRRGGEAPRDPLAVIDLKPEGVSNTILAPDFPTSPSAAGADPRSQGGGRPPRPPRPPARPGAPRREAAAAAPAPAESLPAAPAPGDPAATAAELLSRPDALDLAAAQLFAAAPQAEAAPVQAPAPAPTEEAPQAEPQAEAAPAKRSRAPKAGAVAKKPRASKAKAPKAEAESPQPQAEAPAQAAPQPEPQAAPPAAPEPEAAPTPPKPDRPKRSGWWSRG